MQGNSQDITDGRIIFSSSSIDGKSEEFFNLYSTVEIISLSPSAFQLNIIDVKEDFLCHIDLHGDFEIHFFNYIFNFTAKHKKKLKHVRTFNFMNSARVAVMNSN